MKKQLNGPDSTYRYKPTIERTNDDGDDGEAEEVTTEGKPTARVQKDDIISPMSSVLEFI